MFSFRRPMSPGALSCRTMSPGALLSGALFCCVTTPALAVPVVAVDISPVHSIVARVMSGVGEPGLVLPPGMSPHEYSLRPSEAALIERADLVIWVGPALDPWMEQPIAALGAGAKVLAMQDAGGVETLPVRADGPFEPDAHEDHDGHGHAEEGGGVDPHMWLDPRNAVAFANDVAATLGEIDPGNAAAYEANAADFATEMKGLSAAIEKDLEPARGKPFIVFHDAYQYFEKRFDLPVAGSISLAEGEAPTPARVAEIQERVRKEGVVCAFSEPEFEPKLMRTVIEGTDVRTGVLDPESVTGFPPGPELYPTLLLRLAQGLNECLAR